METMVAMMVVTITLSSFMTVFAYTNLQESEAPDISLDFLNDLRIDNGAIVGLEDNYPELESGRRGYVSMTITIRTVGTVHNLELSLGNPMPGHNQFIENGSFMIPDVNGERYAAVYEVIAFV